MLETVDLCKIYKPKKGLPVKALDKVSLVFPEKGMVFLLGKSGSGKSTLLNLLGGLDKYDHGEIIIKGVSSKSFDQKRFDSYRNTYVGFIFQEYNVLDEFTVGANIALALELQGRKATNEEINRILTEVDLTGYGNRRPNELSGGQLQRVAIARALVKNPEIIMADEPTGALDSNTGRQVLDTLKKLSAEKLVIVVSHDREFAEKYADRIIELADGHVIRDVEWKPENEDPNPKLSFEDDTVRVPSGYRLTEEDREAINKYIEAYQSGVTIGIHGGGRTFTPTDTSAIKRRDGSDFKLIKSKLPLKSAFRIGGSGLKHKKFRLVMTIFLSMIAFTLFALADTFGSYKHVRTCVNSLIDSNIAYASIQKAVLEDEGINSYWDRYSYKLDDSDLEQFAKNTGVFVSGVYVPGNTTLNVSYSYDNSVQLTETEYSVFASSFSGFSEVTKNELDAMGYSLVAGELPGGAKNEIAISKYFCETYIRAGYTDGTATSTEDGLIKYQYEKISSCEDMVGKTLTLGETEYTVTGVIDTGFDLERYIGMTKKTEGETSAAEELVDYVLYTEYRYDVNYSLCRVAFVGEGFIERYIEGLPKISEINSGYVWFMTESLPNVSTEYFSFDFSPYYVGKLSDIESGMVTWLNGEKSVLGEKEIIVSNDAYNVWGDVGGVSVDKLDISGNELLGMLGELNVYGHSEKTDTEFEGGGWKIVGYIDAEAYPDYTQTVIMADSIGEQFVDDRGIYDFAVGAMPETRAELNTLVASCYDEGDDVRYMLQNPVVYELDIVNEILNVLSRVFLFIGIGFAVFASLLLANFIATSISYKKQEIGILRAIGSRSADVFRIFFAESFIIAMINFVLSVCLSAVVTAVVNTVLRAETGILITILHFGIRQIALVLAICLGVAALASFLPVKRIASKRPIDAIRNR